MSEAPALVPKTPAVVDPAVAEPVTVTAPEARTDPVRPMATDALNPASRAEVTPAGSAAMETPVAQAKEENLAKNEEVVEAPAVTEGVLGYKAPGLVKSLIFSKKFFWLSDEPLQSEHLSGYLRTEKAEVAHHNVAHASQTGKGLLFFAKRVEDKDHPAGILNLSDVSDVTKGDLNEFTFKLHGHKHAFQASTKAERDGWVVAIESRLADAKASRDGLVGSEGYKNHLKQLVTATPIGAAKPRSTSRPLKGTDSKVHDGATATDTVASSGSSSDEGKPKHKKDRSQSRKRGGLFGALLGKKEEHDEKKEHDKEEKTVKNEVKQEERLEKEEAKAEKDESKGVIAGGAAPLDAAAIAARVLDQPVVPVEGTKPVAAQETSRPATSEVAVTTSTAEAAPKPVKRNSLFGNLWGKKESSPKDTVPAIATKEPETTPVSATAPRIEEPINTTSTASGTVAPAPTPVAEPSESTPVATTSPAVSPSAPSTDKRRSSFFNALGGKKEKKVEGGSETEGVDAEGKKSNTGKFTGLFRKPSRATPPAHTEKSPTGAEHGPLTTVTEPVVGDPKSPVVTSA